MDTTEGMDTAVQRFFRDKNNRCRYDLQGFLQTGVSTHYNFLFEMFFKCLLKLKYTPSEQFQYL